MLYIRSGPLYMQGRLESEMSACSVMPLEYDLSALLYVLYASNVEVAVGTVGGGPLT